MKVYEEGKGMFFDVSLYPTWFRWKVRFWFISLHSACLYIPHGSDESIRGMVKYNHTPNFISHMVQMKAWMKRDRACFLMSFISHMVQMKGTSHLQVFNSSRSLYPTWFRWKHAKHVQLRDTSRPLYPTWFRWKPEYRGSSQLPMFFFISHMVQMKGYVL